MFCNQNSESQLSNNKEASVVKQKEEDIKWDATALDTAIF
jgi:hypothetical protein